ncbi:MAG: peptidoglycan editing factor PgeF, partial [Cyanobacteria bacterium P01_H01_bin.121]
TTQAQESVWVCSADCSPVLIADLATGQVAAIHAGWRGTAVRIVPEAIAQLQAQGSQLENLRVAIGPAIAGTVYQVAEEVALQVAQSISPNAVARSQAPDALFAQLQALEQPALHVDPEPGKARLDVRRINALQLEALGLQPEQIVIAPHCTYQDPEHFFSYRRTHEKKVQWSGIVSRD